MGSSDKPEEPKGPSSGLLVFRRIVGGTVGGICQAACSHPFDTIKSRIQAGVATSVTECAQATLKNEGFRGFYKGVLPPMTICGFYNATLFSANQAARNLVRPADLPPGADMSLPRIALAGIMAGPACCAVVRPVEVVKVRLQLQTKDASKAEFTGVFDCVVKTVKREGVLSLYNGYSALLLSRTIGLPFYFGGYEMTKKALQGPTEPGKPAPPASSSTALLAGTMAGWSFWSACYPCDFVKTKMQMQPKGTTSFAKVFTETVRTHGVRQLYSGYGACMLRSAPANASVWFAMENTIGWMDRNGW
jgi:solute carrier family 25 carnitine/acylcarnitine transporter 20/29